MFWQFPQFPVSVQYRYILYWEVVCLSSYTVCMSTVATFSPFTMANITPEITENETPTPIRS